ncbi:MAG: succinyl-diaminopimelate desuccinylase [Parvibaculales bacterium]
MDSLQLAQALIRCPSVTPDHAGSLDIIEEQLKPLGFQCHRLNFEGVENLYAKLGQGGNIFCFAGHVDVVPIGEPTMWKHPPFGGEVKDGKLWGRGSADMKTAIACFISAVEKYHKSLPKTAAISLLITSDEEGEAEHGTKKVLEWMQENNEKITTCLVGEPTNRTELGEIMKVGRRGSLSAKLTVKGTSGHIAYPHLAENPIPAFLTLLQKLTSLELDKGSQYFEPSNLEITNIHIGNEASNVIPAEAEAFFNIRYNDHHDKTSLIKKIEQALQKTNIGKAQYDLIFTHHGDSFISKEGKLAACIKKAVKEITGKDIKADTGGGTSDARFIKNHSEVVEFGMVGASMHKTDEHIPLADIEKLQDIYEKVLTDYFSAG